MRALRDIQREFAQAIQDSSADTALAQCIQANGFSEAQRIQIYRNNVFLSLGSALNAAYPVILRLVGERFFRLATQQYAHSHPSRSGNLDDYGSEFAEFLAGFPGTSSLPYLPDVARLEWTCHEVLHAAEHQPIKPASLSGIAEDQYAWLKLRLHPACRLVESDFPVLRIWQVNQEGYAGDQTVDLADGGVRLLAYRHDNELELHTLTAGEYSLLYALTCGADLALACERAFEAAADFDLNSCLLHHDSIGSLASWYLDDSVKNFEL